MNSIGKIGEIALKRLFLSEGSGKTRSDGRKIKVEVKTFSLPLEYRFKFEESDADWQWPSFKNQCGIQGMVWGIELGLKRFKDSGALTLEDLIVESARNTDGWILPSHVIAVLWFKDGEGRIISTEFQIHRISQEQIHALKARQPRISIAFG